MTKFAFDYVVNGIELAETEMAYPTSRCLPYNPNGNLFEMEAIAVDADGNKYAVSWIFEDDGRDYEDFDYSQPDDCRLID